MSSSISQAYGLTPINVRWNVVRGDTAELLVEFLENDETTAVDTSDWLFEATSYDYKGDILDELDISTSGTSVTIIAPADITEGWGTGYSSVVAEVAFDLQVTIDGKIWTPIVGTISVIGDITGASL
jgi:hypothetical protein